MPCIIFYFINCIIFVFLEATNTVLESFTNFTGKHLCWSFFFSVKWWNYIKTFVLHDKSHFCQIFFSHRMRKSNSKLNFTKNCQGGWFCCRQLKISKYSISLAWLGECSKRKVTPLAFDKSQKSHFLELFECKIELWNLVYLLQIDRKQTFCDITILNS